MNYTFQSKRSIGRFHTPGRILLCAAIAALILLVFASSAFADTSLNAYVNNIALYSLDKPNTPLSSGDKVSLSDGLQLYYYLRDIIIDDASTMHFDGDLTPINTASDGYLLTLPDYLNISSGSSMSVFPFDIKINNDTITLGSISKIDDKTIKLDFADDLAANVLASGNGKVGNIFFDIVIMLDPAEVGKRNDVSIPLNGTDSLDLDIAENDPENAKLSSKTGSFDPSGNCFDWVVEIEPEIPVCSSDGIPVYSSGYMFKDTLGNQHKFKAGSFEIKYDSSGYVPATPNYDETSNVISYDLAGVLSETAYIRYKTVATDGLYYDSDGHQMIVPTATPVKVKNHAELYAPGETATPINFKDGTADFSINQWLIKSAKEIDMLNKTMTWELIIDTNGRGFSSIDVYDRIDSRLSIVPGSLKVNNENKSYESGFNGHGTGSSGNLLYTISPVAANIYTITYKTSFTDLSLTDNVNKSMSNDAWLTFEWLSGHGPGPGTTFSIPTIKKPTSLNASIVAKWGRYDPATKLIKWTVRVNANRLDLQSAVIKDNIDPTNQSGVVSDGIVSHNPSAVCTVSSDGAVSYSISMVKDTSASDPDHTYIVTLKKNGTGVDNALGTDTVEYSYYTMATDPAFYANNAETTFSNTVTLDNGVIAASGGTQTLNSLTATANVKGVSKVLKKSGGNL